MGTTILGSNKHERYNGMQEKLCFLHGPCRDVISRSGVDESLERVIRKVGGLCEEAVSLGFSQWTGVS
jgi:hypothetical protein